MINIFIQARMSSERYPGKVLAPVLGAPLIKHVIDRVRTVNECENIVVITSEHETDDPLVAYLKSINCLVWRGDLDNVFMRFQSALLYYPCDYFVRICADSPFIEPNLLNIFVEHMKLQKYDFLSNVFKRKFPRGQSVEIMKTKVFQEISNNQLNDYEREHVFPYFYKNAEKHKTLFFSLSRDLSNLNQCIDTIDDLKDLDSKQFLYTYNETELCILNA